MALISLREYARRRGVALSAVQKAAKTGRIELEGGKVDPVKADAQWKRRTDPAQQRGRNRPEAAAAPVAEAAPAGVVPGTEVPPGGPMPGTGGVDYARSRAVRETYMARLAALEYDVRKGRLVDADLVRSRIFKAGRNARDMLLALPDRLAPRIAADPQQQFEVHRILREELERICAEIARVQVA